MTAAASDFHGTWRLLTMHTRFPDGRVAALYGERPLGFITYTADGHMHAILMDPKRPALGMEVEELGRRRGVRRAAWLLGNLPMIARTANAAFRAAAYSGSWEIRGNEVVHHVLASVLPDWIGTDLVRAYRFDGQQLILTAHYEDGEHIELQWERI